MKNSNPKVVEFLSKASKWKKEYEKLRNFIVDCEELTEEFKWMILAIPLMIKTSC